MIGRFIGGIAALIYDPNAQKYLLVRRSAQKDVGAGSWECPTGRVDQGEGFEEALFREVKEELQVDIEIEFLLGTTHFYRGQEKPENELIGVVYSCQINNPAAIRIGEEHDQAVWLTAGELAGFLPEDHWLHWVVQRAELMRASVAPQTRDLFRREGFLVGGRNTYR